jgi:hypothetical protein
MATSSPLFPPTTGPFTTRRNTPASYVVWSDGSNYHADSMNGGLDYTSPNLLDAAPVVNNAFSALTSGRTWREKVVLKGSFNLGARLTIPAYTDLDMTDATVKLNNSVNDIMYGINGSNVKVKGGVHDKNGSNNTNNALIQSSLLNVQCDNIDIEEMTMLNVNGFGIWNPNAFTFRGNNHRYMRNTIYQLAGVNSDILVFTGIIGGEVSHNIVFSDKGLGINIYESDNAQCFGNTVKVGNTGGQGISMASSLHSSIFGNTVILGFSNNTGISAYEETDNGASARDQIGGLIYGNHVFGNSVSSTFGFQLFDCSYVKLFGNQTDSCQYGLLFTGGQPVSDNIRVENNEFKSNITQAVLASVIPTNSIFRNNAGYDPVGLLSTPYDNTNNLVGPISGNSATLTSAKVYTCRETSLDLIFTGGTLTVYQKNGQNLPYFAPSGNFMHLEPGDTFMLTFSVTPTTQQVWAN